MKSIICFNRNTGAELFKVNLQAIPRANEYLIYNDVQYVVHYVIYTESHVRLLVADCKTTFF